MVRYRSIKTAQKNILGNHAALYWYRYELKLRLKMLDFKGFIFHAAKLMFSRLSDLCDRVSVSFNRKDTQLTRSLAFKDLTRCFIREK